MITQRVCTTDINTSNALTEPEQEVKGQCLYWICIFKKKKEKKK